MTAKSSLVSLVDPATRVAEIRADNHQGDVSASDIAWLCDEVMRLREAIQYVIVSSPGTPDSVKGYFTRKLG